MNRRGFLAAMLGAAAAPAIVKAEHLMKIVVPKQEIIQLKFSMIDSFAEFDVAETYPKELVFQNVTKERYQPDSGPRVDRSLLASAHRDWFFNRPAGVQAMRSEDEVPLYEKFIQLRHPQLAEMNAMKTNLNLHKLLQGI